MVYSTPVAIPPVPPQTESYIRKRTHSFSVQPYGTVPHLRMSGSTGSGAAGGVSRRQAIYGQNQLAAVSFPTMQPDSPSTPATTFISIPASAAVSAVRHAPAQSVDTEERPTKKQKRKEKEAPVKTQTACTPPISAPTPKSSSRFNIFHSRSSSVGDAIAAASPKMPKRLSLPGFGKSRTDGVRTPSPAPLSTVFSFPSISPPRSPSPTKMQISTPRAPSPTKMKPTPIVSSTATTTNLAASMQRLKRSPTKSIEPHPSAFRRSPLRAKPAPKVSEDLDMMMIVEEEEEEGTASPLSPPGLSTTTSTTGAMEVDKDTPAVRRAESLSQPRRLPKWCERSPSPTPEPPAVRTAACPSPHNSTPRFNRIPTPPPPPPRFSSPLGPVRRILSPRPQFPRPPKSEQVVHLGGDKLRIRCGEKGRPFFVQSLGEKGQAAEMYRRVVIRNAKVVWRETCERRRRERKERLLGDEDEGYTLRVAVAEAAAASVSVKKEKDGQQKPKEKTQTDYRMDLDESAETPSDLESLPDIPDMEFDLEDEESDRTPLPKTPNDADMRFNLTPPPPAYARLPSENLQQFYQTQHRQGLDAHTQYHLQFPLHSHHGNLTSPKSFSHQFEPSESKHSIARDALLLLASGRRPVDLRGSTTTTSTPAESGILSFASPRSNSTKLPFKAPAVISSSRSPTLSS